MMLNRTKKITIAQTERLVSFFEENPDLVCGKIDGGKERKDRLWEELTKELNNMSGAFKTTEKWRKTWSDMKISVRDRAYQLKREILKTGGRNVNVRTLSPVEERIMQLIEKNTFDTIEESVERSAIQENAEIVVKNETISDSPAVSLITVDVTPSDIDYHSESNSTDGPIIVNVNSNDQERRSNENSIKRKMDINNKNFKRRFNGDVSNKEILDLQYAELEILNRQTTALERIAVAIEHQTEIIQFISEQLSLVNR